MDPYDLPVLLEHRQALESLDPAGTPALRALGSMGPCRSLALLPGSFNPPTAAHMLLVERALREGFSCVGFVVGRVTAGKERTGMLLEDRLLTLRSVSGPGVSVFATSHPLYVEQAEAVAHAFPGVELTFLVGSDKIEQIFDARWYDDRDAVLDRLFALAGLLVAPRSDDGQRVRDVLAAPENRRWRDRVAVLPLHPAVSDLSSTRVRGLLLSGADPSGLVPPDVASLLHETRAFAPPLLIGGSEVSAYRLRARLLDALWAARDWAREAADLRGLMSLALDGGGEGERFRAALLNGGADRDALERAQASAR